LLPIGPNVRVVQAKLTKADGVVFTSRLWTVDNRELSRAAEEVATWIVAESGDPRDLEAAISVRDAGPGEGYSH